MIHNKPSIFTAVLASSLALLAHAALAASIGVNFVNNGDEGVQNGATDALASVEIAGVTPQANWNNLGRYGSGVGLKNDLGLATTAAASWDALGVWSTGASLGTGNGKLMSGYLDPSYGGGVADPNPTSVYFTGTNNKPLVYLSGLSAWLAAEGATGYNIILYVDGDATDNRIGEHWVQAVTGSGNSYGMTAGSDLTPHLFGMDGSNFSGTFSLISNNATSAGAAEVGNYMVFSGLTDDQVLIRSSAVNYSSDSISGFQIIAVPEPTSAMLVGLGGVLFGLRRRRV